MLDLCKLIFGTVIDLLRSRATLEAEILVLRQQINVLRRANPKRLPFRSIDRLILGGVCRLFPKMGAVRRLVGIEVGVVSGVFNLESPGVDAPGWRLRHEEAYHTA